MKPWEVLASRTLIERRWLTVREDRVRTASVTSSRSST
jgi:hypothetical protein